MKILLTIMVALLMINCEQNEPLDYYVENVSNPIINLNGTWKININPADRFWELDELNEEWENITVPGECMMQGFPIKHDKPFVYKKRFEIPADFSGKQIKLQFEGVYSYARVWINGDFVRDHSGGFTRWECDITPFVDPGKAAMLTLEVTDKADNISYASGYAKHQIGGILRTVSLLAMPINFPENLTIVTDLDSDYKNANLNISGILHNKAENAKVKLRLTDISNRSIPLQNSEIELDNTDSFFIDNLVESPEKWDAEHPNLYKLMVSYFENGQLLYQKTYRVGFREVEINGNKLFVNGKEVKLRGACRHDIHPLLGRVSNPEYELKDVALAKEANMNFIRTSHYPPTENFLRLCDEFGIYVEDETAVCFVGSHRTKEYSPGTTQSDPNYTERYLSQLEEMVTNHKNHPSIILWSVGNENHFGTNFKKSYDWVKESDTTRPAIFSYPGHVPDSVKSYDILSMHYPDLSGDLNQYGKITEAFGYNEMPVIFDEWAHVACYNPFTIKEDPNIRSFWGQSLDSMWIKVFEADGGLGGAIWGMVDETFMLPEDLPGFNEWWGKIDKNIIPPEYAGHTIGYGEWGIIDTWRRKKPEFWNTKKAYSPVKLLKTTFDSYTPGTPLSVPVYNRFDHTNFNELTIKYTYQNQANILNPIDIKPHNKGIISIPMNEWDTNESVFLEIFNNKNRLLDSYLLRIKPENKINDQEESAEEIRITENANQLTVICENDTRIVFDKSTGLISEIQRLSGTIDFSGPYLNLRTKGKSLRYSNNIINEYSSDWKLKNFSFKKDDNQVIVSIKGKNSIRSTIEFEISVSVTGEIKTKYHVKKIPKENIREIGIRFEIDPVIDSLSWERDGYWSYYPADHLSASVGKVSLYSDNLNTYRKAPEKSWVFDSKSFFYNGISDEVLSEQFTNVAKGTKENIRTYNLYEKGREVVSVQGNGDVSCRIAKGDDKFILYIDNEMDYIDLSWGNYQRNILLEKDYSNVVVIKINSHADNAN